MKNQIKSLLVIALAAVFITTGGCKKDKTLDDVITDVTGSMKATVGGVAWTAAVPAAAVTKGVLVINGQPNVTSLEKTIILTINGTDVKTYSLNGNVVLKPAAAECFVLYKLTNSLDPLPADYYVSYSVSITITKYDVTTKRLSGTFIATLRRADALTDATKEIKIENGTFTNINFVVTPTN